MGPLPRALLLAAALGAAAPAVTAAPWDVPPLDRALNYQPKQPLQVFTADGLATDTYGDFEAPVALSFDGLGRSWVADRVTGDVSIFRGGSLVDTYVPDQGAPFALSSRPDGSVYVAVV